MCEVLAHLILTQPQEVPLFLFHFLHGDTKGLLCSTVKITL